MRGAQASMLYVQQNFDDGVFTITDQLGVLNSQNIDLKAFVKPADILQIDLGVGATLPLEHIKSDSDLVAGSSLEIDGVLMQEVYSAVSNLCSELKAVQKLLLNLQLL